MRRRDPNSPTPSTRRLRLASLLLGLPLFANGAAADIAGSPDITIDVGGSLIVPADVADDVSAPGPLVIDLGPLPEGADVGAYSPFPGSGEFFCLGHTLELPGAVVAQPRDVVFWDGAAYSIVLDGAAAGIPDGAAIDALAYDPGSGDVWLSFDTTVDLSGTVLRDADVVDANTLALVFDASAAGVPQGTDVDGVSMVPGSSEILLSFDVSGSIGGVSYADEDVLRYDPTGGTWTLELDASTVDLAWEASDLDALHLVPEPGRIAMLACGLGLLGGLARRRRRLRAV